MQKDNNVIFKGGKNGIVIILDESASYEQILGSLRSKIRSASKFFAGAQTTITFKGKALSEAEIMSLISIIGEETDLSISFIEDMTGSFTASPEGSSEGSVAQTPPPQGPAAKPPMPLDGTYFHKSGMRSGGFTQRE